MKICKLQKTQGVFRFFFKIYFFENSKKFFIGKLPEFFEFANFTFFHGIKYNKLFFKKC